MNQKQKRDLAERFATLRGTRSYVQFAKDTRMSVSLLQRYETGGGIPSVENLIVLAQAEKVNFSWLLLGDGPMHK